MFRKNLLPWQNSLWFPWHWWNGQNSLTFFQNSLTIPWPGENFVLCTDFSLTTWQPWFIDVQVVQSATATQMLKTEQWLMARYWFLSSSCLSLIGSGWRWVSLIRLLGSLWLDGQSKARHGDERVVIQVHSQGKTTVKTEKMLWLGRETLQELGKVAKRETSGAKRNNSFVLTCNFRCGWLVGGGGVTCPPNTSCHWVGGGGGLGRMCLCIWRWGFLKNFGRKCNT